MVLRDRSRHPPGACHVVLLSTGCYPRAVSKPSPETIAIIAVGATLLIAVCSVGIGLGMLWSNGQARTDAAIAELRNDVNELRRDVHDVGERLAHLEGAILARSEPGAEG